MATNLLQVLSIHNLQNNAAIFTKMLLNENLLDAVEQIMDTKDILLHHTKAHVKPPGKGSPFPMHQVILVNYSFKWYRKSLSLKMSGLPIFSIQRRLAHRRFHSLGRFDT